MVKQDSAGTDKTNDCRSSDLKAIEQRVNVFLDKECVHPVMLQDYLKALGTYEESQKCHLQLKM